MRCITGARSRLLAATVATLLLVCGSPSAAQSTDNSKVGLAYTTTPSYFKGTVWVATASGGARRKLGPGDTRAMSPDGHFVAAVRPDGTGLVLYRTDDGAPIRIRALSKDSVEGVSWSSDSRYVAVTWFHFSSTNSKLRWGVTVISVPPGKVVASTSNPGQIGSPSFAPGKPYRVVFFDSRSKAAIPRGNLEEIRWNDSPQAKTASIKTLLAHQLVANPIWTHSGIIYDKATLRASGVPAYQLMLRHNGRATQITHMRIRSDEQGLVPVAASQSGGQLLANRVGDLSTDAYAVNVRNGTFRRIRVTDRPLAAETAALGLSPDGRQVLLEYLPSATASSPEQLFKHEAIASVPFPGGKLNVLVGHAFYPSWR